jgi:hypothetical protein
MLHQRPEKPLRDTARARHLVEENRELKQKLAEQEREHRDEQHRQQVETVVLLHAKNRNLTPAQVQEVAARVERERKAFVRDDKNAKRTFPAYENLKLAIADIVGGVRPAAHNGTPTALPPTFEGSTPPPATDAIRRTREERERVQREASDRARDQRHADRQAYADALKKYGFTDPRLGYPGSGR